MQRKVIGLIGVLVIAWGGLLITSVAGVSPRLGLDLQGGTSVVLTAPEGTEQDILDVAVDIMRRRIEDVGGVQEPEIAVSGGNTVLVQLPGITDSQRALDAIGTTGQLSFRPVLDSTPGQLGPLALAATPSTTSTEAGVEPNTTTTVSVPDNIDPQTGLTIDDDPFLPDAYLLSSDSFGTEVLHLGPAQLLGVDVASAIPQPPGTHGGSGWAVSLDLTSEGGDKFATLTGDAAQYSSGDPRRQIAIVLDGDVIAAPAVNESVQAGVGITGGRAQITLGASTDSEAEAQNLAVVLRYGSLPVSFERSQVEQVSATLGSDSLRVGLIAGAAGLILVAAVLVAYYRALGLVAIFGLTVFGSLLITIFSLLGRYQGLTLTLAGVTGIIVSVGITADSYIVYFERIKDEVRNGKTIPSAVTDGFRAAYRTILTADTVSLMGAALLWILAVGPVKGFALSLGIATVLDLIVARAYTRRAAWIVGHTGLGERGAFSIAGAAGEAVTA